VHGVLLLGRYQNFLVSRPAQKIVILIFGMSAHHPLLLSSDFSFNP
jgi:hypothetical protein